MSQNKSASLDMTKGNPASLLIRFAIPMLIGGIFQLLYNMVDSVVVGKFVITAVINSFGKDAMASYNIGSRVEQLALVSAAVMLIFARPLASAKLKGQKINGTLTFVDKFQTKFLAGALKGSGCFMPAFLGAHGDHCRQLIVGENCHQT